MLNSAFCAALRNWKTTTTGVLASASAYVAMFPDDFHNYPALVHFSKFFMVGGLAAMGLVSRDTKAVCDPTKDSNHG